MSWDNTVALGYSYQVNDETITHQIVDRPIADKQYLSRWLLSNSIRKHKVLLLLRFCS